jgi:peptidoglycan/LPS O-acetylase OafA/YrhL
LVLSGLAAFAAIILVTGATDGMNATYDLGLPRAFVGFVMGTLAYEARTWRRPPAPGTLAALELVMLVMLAAFVCFAGKGPLSFCAPLVFAAVVYVYSFEAGTVSRVLKTKPVQALGLWSYSIYMVHMLLISGVDLVTVVVFGPQVRGALTDGTVVLAHANPFVLDLMGLCYLAAVIAVARLTYRLIERPWQQRFTDLSKRIPEALATPKLARTGLSHLRH